MHRVRWVLFILGIVVCGFFMPACDVNDEDECTAANAHDDDDDNDTQQTQVFSPPILSEPVAVVPSPGLPDEAVLQPGNNNLDVAIYQGRVFLAFRTAPSHFASKKAQIHVVSSVDEETWEYEGSFSQGTDLREPRLLSWDGRLFLYFAVLGKNPLNFEPQGMMAAAYLGPGQWTEPVWFYEEGFIPWRTKVLDGTPYLLTYVGGEGIYDINPPPIEVHWLTTTDGFAWEPVVPGQPAVLEGGGSETDFAFLEDGTLIAVSRNEMGEDDRYGMHVCRAEAKALGDWNCVHDPRKYDSPLLFAHNGAPYLIGRRNLSASGHYDLGMDELPRTVQHLLYELVYWLMPKRCALWRIDPQTLDVTWVLDLPSKGDTCFPALLQKSSHDYTVYNYTSPLDGPELSWVAGQLGSTSIIRVDLTFPAPGGRQP